MYYNPLNRDYKNHIEVLNSNVSEQTLRDTLDFYCNLRSKYDAVDVIRELRESSPISHATPGNAPLNMPVTAADGTHSRHHGCRRYTHS